jgi:hypothetical protein
MPFFLHGANFHVALGEAERLGMALQFSALIQSLAAYAQNIRGCMRRFSHRDVSGIQS